jgi:peptidoglycan/xylan/chitin deacetylase (PgdA/CDA1 family)
MSQIKPDPMLERDFLGYGEHAPNPDWPGGARIAVNFNLNIEGGAERSLAHGDAVSEGALTDVGMPSQARREPMVESSFEYGSRRGVWRVLDILSEHSIPISVFAVAQAMERNSELARACVTRGYEIVAHGYRWLDYASMPEQMEREHIRLAIESLIRTTGVRPVGWMTGRPSANTRRLLAEMGGFLYDRDSLADELPYWLRMQNGPHLVIPCSYETNDNRWNEHTGFVTADDFFSYMKDAFDTLYDEGRRGAPKLLSIGLHDRLIGRPGRSAGLRRLIEYMHGTPGVWFCRGVDVAKHWRERFPVE